MTSLIPKPSKRLEFCRKCRRGKVRSFLGMMRWQEVPSCFVLGEGVMQVMVVCPECEKEPLKEGKN